MAVIKAGSSQFPFHITDVAALLRLNIRRRGPDFLYVDCPLCGDHRGKLYLKTSRDVWHCNYCQESGGMLALYAKVYGISNADAYREICEALQTGDYAPEYQSYQNQQPQEIAQSVRASRQAIHQTLSMLFSMLSLTPKHRAHLREVRGLTDDQIERFGFKSTPPPYLCKSLTARLLKQGCTLQGVPGFYMAEDGRWTVRFGTRTAGILIPARSADGLVCGAQIRLDIPIREENAPADKEGTKYLWLSSSSKPMGTSSESPIHFVGDPCSRVVYVTEGLLKADICHALMNRTFAATAGANNVSKLDELFAFLKKNGTEEIIEAQDMDKYRNVHVEKGASKIYLMARKHGLQCRRLTWNPNYKGLDDWQLALRKDAAKAPKTMTFREQYLYGVCEVSEIDACVERWHKTQPDGVSLQAYLGLPDEEYQAFLQPGGNARLAALLNAQRKQLGCRIYQLEFTDTEKTKPFAFSGIDALHKAGFQQPPASEYRLVHDETLYCPKDEPDLAVLERVFDRYNGKLPADYPGRCIAPSDVLELYDAEKRRYYYRDIMPAGDININAQFEDDASAPIKNPPQITAFMINGVSAVINHDTKAITIILPYGTDLKHVAPTIVTANASKVEPSSAQRVNLSTPKAYRVYASNGAYVTYTVTAYTEEPSPTQSLWEKLQNQINSNPNWWELAEYQKKTGYYK